MKRNRSGTAPSWSWTPTAAAFGVAVASFIWFVVAPGFEPLLLFLPSVIALLSYFGLKNTKHQKYLDRGMAAVMVVLIIIFMTLLIMRTHESDLQQEQQNQILVDLKATQSVYFEKDFPALVHLAETAVANGTPLAPIATALAEERMRVQSTQDASTQGFLPTQAPIDTPPHQNANQVGLDYIFMIDQSSSMSGAYQGSDPFGLRFQAVSLATSMMIDEVLYSGVNEYRVAVVNFGTNAEAWNFRGESEIPVFWQVISPKSVAEAQDLRMRNEASISDMAARVSNLGWTDFTGAFKLAYDLLQARSDTNRKGVIVLLTDGFPATPTNTNEFDRITSEMDELIEFVDSHFSERIYLVGLNNDPRGRNPFLYQWNALPNVEIILVRDISALLDAFRTVINETNAP